MNVAPFIRTRQLGKVNVPTVTLAHGGGGKAMKDLIDDVFVAAFDNRAAGAAGGSGAFRSRRAGAPRRPARFHDRFLCGRSAVLPRRRHRQARGVRHGQRSRGRRRDAAVSVLRRDRRRGHDASTCCGASRARWRKPRGTPALHIVTGDTKVVQRGACDKLFITTTGIGVIRRGLALGARSARAGDVVLVNGLLGDHGAAILCARGDMALDTPIESDCAPLHGLIETLLAAAPGIRFLRDATRGGLATVLNEIADASQVAIEIDEARDADPRGGQGVLRNPRARSALSRQRGQDRRRSRRRTKPMPRWRRCERIRSARRSAIIGRVSLGEAGRVDHADGVRRAADRRHAGRRATAADLLRGSPCTNSASSETSSPSSAMLRKAAGFAG